MDMDKVYLAVAKYVALGIVIFLLLNGVNLIITEVVAWLK